MSGVTQVEGNMSWSRGLLIISAAVRLALIAFGNWQDAHFEVKYTDIDYEVFTDAAAVTVQGGSPFQRSTYRYSPLLAYLLVPNVLLYRDWGKILFSATDLFVGWQLGEMVRPQSARLLAMALWLLNPFTFSIATRGNCESLICALLLSIVSCISKGRVVLGAALFGLAVHFRIFPIIYCLSLFLSLSPNSTAPHWTLDSPHDPLGAKDNHPDSMGVKSKHHDPTGLKGKSPGPTTPRQGQRGLIQVQGASKSALTKPEVANSAAMESSQVKSSSQVRSQHGLLGWISWNGVLFGLISAAVFFLFTCFFYYVYGDEFLNEALLYHASRADHRHNFSIYFYSIYLGLGSGSSTRLEGLLAFLPQLSCQLCLSVAFARWDLPFCLLAQTLAFVAFNKVITAQYFVWFFALLPLVVPSIRMTWTQTLACGGVWLFAQLHWLAWAYQLEFGGQNVYLPLWGASCVFFIANVFVLCQIIRTYRTDAPQNYRHKQA